MLFFNIVLEEDYHAAPKPAKECFYYKYGNSYTLRCKANG